MPQTPQLFDAPVTRRIRLPYLLHLPADYRHDDGRTWPLILFLHGFGERGSDPEAVKKHGIPRRIAQGWNPPFVVISPQCPQHSLWPSEMHSLMALLDDATARLAVDPGRIYLTGLSAGGYMTSWLATAYPERFAAIAPVSGGGLSVDEERLKGVPVWAFHGAKDELCPVSAAEDMVAAVNAAGGNARLKIYPGTGHNAWVHAYRNPALYTWFLQHQLRE